MAQTSPDIDNQQEQIEFLKAELTQHKQKVKELQQKEGDEDKQPQDEEKDEESKFDQPEAILDSPLKPPKEEQKHQN
eukprot:CAMPEP_0170512478 /NCGR_PEP_ID=MMETSP0208-20121228/66874_1 /TAXON_ID=197538 /ORGANISM="Strombidium inclinatum, Strain S3" /LENGTH=76 /DNA_ID=CAMNT_0010796113 /DNA_START=4338 /DNA_END=4568 /DNA_ORIENTATION=+